MVVEEKWGLESEIRHWLSSIQRLISVNRNSCHRQYERHLSVSDKTRTKNTSIWGRGKKVD